MGEILLQVRAAFRGLCLVGLALLWILAEPRAEPLKLAGVLVDGALLSTASEDAADPLAELPQYMQRPLAEYRHRFRHSAASSRADMPFKLQALEEIPVSAVLMLGEKVFVDASPRNASPLSEIYIASYRAQLGKLQTWAQQAELGEYATLDELNSRLQTRMQLPVLEQSVSIPNLLAFAAIAIAVLQAFLVSVLATANKLMNSENAMELRAWLPLHHHAFGPLLSVLTIYLPPALWASQTTFIPMLRGDWRGAVSILVVDVVLAWASFMTWRRILVFRRQVLELTRNPGNARPNAIHAPPTKLAA